LSQYYNSKENSEIKSYLTYIFGLPFLDPKDVGDCFAIELGAIQPVSDVITKFADYLIETYIAEDSTFPPHMWAEHSSSVTRTTNACESFHSRFNASFYVSHPNIFIFTDILVNFQIDTYIKQKSATKAPKIFDSKIIKKKEFLDCEITNLKIVMEVILPSILLKRCPFISVIINKYNL
jgi:hypothetical protein